MKNFNIKQYLRNELTKDNCDHLVLKTEGYNEGLPVRIDYECLLCNKKLKGKNKKISTENRYVYHHMPNTTNLGETNLTNVIHQLINANITKEEIDLVGMLHQVDPLLRQCNQEGRIITEADLNAKTYSKK